MAESLFYSIGPFAGIIVNVKYYEAVVFGEMKKILVAVFLVFLLPFSLSVELGSIIEEAQSYSRQYENGEMNFLQLNVSMNFLRQKVYEEFFGKQFGSPDDLSEEDAFLFSLFRDTQAAYNAKNFEKLNSLMAQIESEFVLRQETEAIKMLNALRQAIDSSDFRKAEELGGKLEGLFREEKRNEEFSGWPREKVEELFGEPTSFQDRVWAENLKRDVRVKEPVAVWEKTVFEGTKVRTSFNAWPHLAEYSDKIVAYYWVDFESSLKNNATVPDPALVVSDVKQRALSFYDSGQGGEELAEIIVKNERAFEELLREKKGQCEQVMNGFFGSSNGTSRKIQWNASFFENDQLEVQWFLDETIDDQWHAFHSRFQLNPNPVGDHGFVSWDFDRESALNQSVQENMQELKLLLQSAKQDTIFQDWQSLMQRDFRISQYIEVLNEKANRKDLDFSVTELEAFLDSLFAEFAVGLVKEQVSVTDFEEQLFEDSRQRIDSYCSGESNWCGEGFSCFNAACVSAKGGNEACDNGIDDDSDNIVDCQDPDCIEFLACGRICEPVCGKENGCWQCNSDNCRQECDACGKCNDANPGNPQACNSACESCGTCTQFACPAVCDSCWGCENEYFGDGCFAECKPCDECNKENNADCSSACLSCNNCRHDAGSFQCEPPRVFDKQKGWCECVQQECPANHFLDYGTCSCVFQEPPQGQCEITCPSGEVPDFESCSCETVPVQETCSLVCPPESVLNTETCSCEQPQACTIECPEGQTLDLESCQCIDQAPEQENGNGQLNEFYPLFPSIATGFTVLGGFEDESGENENKGEKGTSSCENVSCSANQVCSSEKGWCECRKGFFDCDGDWLNGCESSTQCKPCQSDTDCALARCSEDRFSVESFNCTQGESWEETVAGFSFRGSCEKKTSGEVNGHIWFDLWGEKFEPLQSFRQQAYQKSEFEWCAKELAKNIKERLELQGSFNQNFLNWFFEVLVFGNQEQFAFQGEAIHLVYDAFQQNSERTANSLKCLGRTDWPKEFVPLNYSFETPSGKIRFWEELKTTNFWGENQQVMSPYLEAWFFPDKEEFKKILAEELEKEGPKGPSPVEIQMMRQNPEVMQKINNISNAFGGEAKILLSIKDNGEQVIGMLLSVNKDSLVRMDFSQQVSTDNDATISLSYDFFYDTMSTILKDLEGSQTIKPYWEQNQFEPPQIDDALIMIGLFSKIIFAIPTGQVQVEPVNAVPAVILTFVDMISLMQLK